MAVYKFKVTFEDYYEIFREIEILSNQTFMDFHKAIHESLGYDAEKPSSFYVSTDNWIKGEEITLTPDNGKDGVKLMEGCKMSKYVNDPHQKFYYVYNFSRPFDFLIELVSIKLDKTADRVYPFLVKKVGDAPRINNKNFDFAQPSRPTSGRDFEFLSEMGYDEEEEMEGLKHVGVGMTDNDDMDMAEGDEDRNTADGDDDEGGDEYGSGYDDEYNNERDDY